MRIAQLTELLHHKTRSLDGPIDLAPLVERLSRARIVMLGEATHGTQDFYSWRRILSEWLVVKHGFRFIAVEGDWPPCRLLDRYIKGESDGDAVETLQGFRRWPTWMWANSEICRLAEGLRSHNDRLASAERAGFYGLDIYSLFESIDAALRALEPAHPLLARQLRRHYECFAAFERNEKRYVKKLLASHQGCEEQALAAMQDLLRARMSETDAIFDSSQNARVIRNAERYYRALAHGNEESWNVRDEHMLETLIELLEHHGPDAKAVVWAHNTHIGDFRATTMAQEGLVNLGGLARQHFGRDAVALVGFGTYEGEVVASRAWEGPVEVQKLPAARTASLESVFHDLAALRGVDRLFAMFDEADRDGMLGDVIGHRAVGVVYDPRHDRHQYVPTRLAERYDAFVFIDRTRALAPLSVEADPGEMPETWPVGS